MAEQGVNNGRRRFLTATTAVVGGVGAVFAAVPFVKSWKPSARARLAGAPVEADISKIEAGQKLTVQWRGQPIFIVRRTPEMLATLATLESNLRDPKSENEDMQPEYARNGHRSVKPEYLVLIGICTHLGCVPLDKFQAAPQAFDAEWKGGFFCPCHGSKFDMAGRVFEGVPAPFNLRVPPHKYVDDKHIVVGLNPDKVS